MLSEVIIEGHLPELWLKYSYHIRALHLSLQWSSYQVWVYNSRKRNTKDPFMPDKVLDKYTMNLECYWKQLQIILKYWK